MHVLDKTLVDTLAQITRDLVAEGVDRASGGLWDSYEVLEPFGKNRPTLEQMERLASDPHDASWLLSASPELMQACVDLVMASAGVMADLIDRQASDEELEQENADV